jgi:hypothetical protein
MRELQGGRAKRRPVWPPSKWSTTGSLSHRKRHQPRLVGGNRLDGAVLWASQDRELAPVARRAIRVTHRFLLMLTLRMRAVSPPMMKSISHFRPRIAAAVSRRRDVASACRAPSATPPVVGAFVFVRPCGHCMYYVQCYYICRRRYGEAQIGSGRVGTGRAALGESDFGSS